MIHQNESIANTLMEKYKVFLNDDIFLKWFPSDISSGLKIKREQNFINRILDTSRPSEEIPLAMQRSFNIYNLYVHYAIEKLEDEKLFLENIAIAGEYAKYSIKFMKDYPEKFQTVEPFNQNQLFHTLCFLVLTGWIDEAKEYAKFIGDNLEKLVNIENRLLIPQFWFVLKLLDTDFTTNLQVITFPYDKCQEYENDNFIELLLELKLEHLKLSRLHVVYDMFPYEVLVFIKLMTIKDINTTHPFMQTKIVQSLLQLEKIDSVDVENINELLNKFFYESTFQETKQGFQSKSTPKTGRYQAILPKDHPQYETLKADPNAYRTYKEGEIIDNRGLETYDLKNIEWICIE